MTPAEYIRAKLSEGDQKTFDAVLAEEREKALGELNMLARLYAAEGVIDTLVLTNTECTHDAEPDYCDSCAFERERRTAAAMAAWRKTVPGSGFPGITPS